MIRRIDKTVYYDTQEEIEEKIKQLKTMNRVDILGRGQATGQYWIKYSIYFGVM